MGIVANFSSQFKFLAGYNRWANCWLSDTCQQLVDEEFQTPRPAFFGSILGTLNHVLVGDQAWLARLRGEPPPGVALDHALFNTLPALTQMRHHLDQEIIGYVKDFAETDIAEIIH